jgi:hypothetical protein
LTAQAADLIFTACLRTDLHPLCACRQSSPVRAGWQTAL